MKTKLTIELNFKDCEQILFDLENIIKNKDGLTRETYLLCNKLQGMISAYNHIEEK